MLFSLPNRLYVLPAIFLLNLYHINAESVSIGDEVCVTGYIMDGFCIESGVLMDNTSVNSLSAEGPPAHSLHCLVDMGVCNSSPYEVLVELEDGSYGRAWQAHSNELLLNHARATGVCESCASGNSEDKGNISSGYKATVIGTVKTLAMGDIPPVIEVSAVGDFEDFESLCLGPKAEPESTSTASNSKHMKRILITSILLSAAGSLL